MPLLTVFTPTYNRAHTLKRTYDSLCRQTNQDFVWIVVDDGSTDDTKSLVESWKAENKLRDIRYYYKENGGLHTGYNKAIEMADTELMVSLDSDDYMPENAVELIEKKWKADGSEEYGGIVGLDYNTDGSVLGSEWPETKTINLCDVMTGKIKIVGDKKNVVRTDLYKKYAPMPSFKGEKNFNPHYMALQISFDYDFLVLNENLCYVEYQSDGMTANQWKQYYNSPNSFLETRKLYMRLPGATLGFKFKQSIHYISSCIFARKKHWIKNSPCKVITFFAIPFGVLFSFLVRHKAKN